MRKPQPGPRRKKRTREHVIADLGLNFVERQVLLCGHTLEEIRRAQARGVKHRHDG